jgi:2-amino-4-hydroxy-6-hydroxymethyldihydropteridine diphosphokinase
VQMKIVTVYLGLGSNMGDKQENLQKALDYISQRMRVEKKSSVYDTAPIGNINQSRFLNMVCQVNTSIPASTLLFLLKGIEAKVGRMPGPVNGPRIIDIDILLYGDEVVNGPDLQIPHPRMVEREFILAPLAEIAPDLVHPVAKKTIKELLLPVEGKQGVAKTNFKF